MKRLTPGTRSRRPRTVGVWGRGAVAMLACLLLVAGCRPEPRALFVRNSAPQDILIRLVLPAETRQWRIPAHVQGGLLELETSASVEVVALDPVTCEVLGRAVLPDSDAFVWYGLDARLGTPTRVLEVSPYDLGGVDMEFHEDGACLGT